mmetsp:Transcript_35057/g.67846  ORF Transcript_35057/g.67846 Transcript_35057/m.67846 type:complete len:354 (-) Transcript_35057:285-1346(-)
MHIIYIRSRRSYRCALSRFSMLDLSTVHAANSFELLHKKAHRMIAKSNDATPPMHSGSQRQYNWRSASPNRYLGRLKRESVHTRSYFSSAGEIHRVRLVLEPVPDNEVGLLMVVVRSPVDGTPFMVFAKLIIRFLEELAPALSEDAMDASILRVTPDRSNHHALAISVEGEVSLLHDLERDSLRVLRLSKRLKEHSLEKSLEVRLGNLPLHQSPLIVDAIPVVAVRGENIGAVLLRGLLERVDWSHEKRVIAHTENLVVAMSTLEFHVQNLAVALLHGGELTDVVLHAILSVHPSLRTVGNLLHVPPGYLGVIRLKVVHLTVAAGVPFEHGHVVGMAGLFLGRVHEPRIVSRV